MQRQPDALQPDDQHELQTASADGCQQPRQVAGRERADPEQGEVEHRIFDAALDPHEQTEQGDAAEEVEDHQRAGPPHRVAAVGLDAVGDADEHHDEADAEGDVAPPVDPGGQALAGLPQLEVRPHGAEEAERHVDPEDQAPVGISEKATDNEADERPGRRRDHADPHGQAPLVDREGVREDGH